MSDYRAEIRMGRGGDYVYEIYAPGKILPEPGSGSFKSYAKAAEAASRYIAYRRQNDRDS